MKYAKLHLHQICSIVSNLFTPFLVNKIKGIGDKRILIDELPGCVTSTFKAQMSGKDVPPATIPNIDLSIIGSKLEQALFPFQRESVW